MAGRGDIQIQNPCTKWFKWKGSTGTIVYYDKLTKQNVEVSLPFTFLLLDVLSTVKGYDESTKESIWSNEVRDIKNSILTVKSGNNILISGNYAAVKDKVIAAGGGYAASCYIAFFDENKELVIGNMTMTGSSLGGGTHLPADKKMKDVEVGAWIEFSKNYKADMYSKAIVITKDERVCTQGATKFFCPKFDVKDVSEETDKAAIELNKKLQLYLETYLKVEAKPDENVATAAEAVTQVGKEEQFEKNAEEKPFDIPKKESAVIETQITGNEPDDIPF